MGEEHCRKKDHNVLCACCGQSDLVWTDEGTKW